MKRMLALTILILFAAGPALRWQCAELCGSPAPATHPSCHKPAAANQHLSGGHDCADHAAPAAIAVKRTEIAVQLSAALNDLPLDLRTADLVRHEAVFDRFGPSPPLILLTPLRI